MDSPNLQISTNDLVINALFAFSPKFNPFDIPAAVHIDNTARVHTLTKDHNEKLHTLIEKFEERTGIPILINTSLNIKGRPIVENPEDVIELFKFVTMRN